jgi:bifunctional DNase/RNase
MAEEFEGPDGPENLDEPPSFFPYDNGVPRPESSSGELVEVQVEGVFRADNAGQISHFVLVSDGSRKLPIIIGPFESQAIQLVLENSRPDRPLTHDLLKNILDRIDTTVDRIVIDDFWNTIYYAKLYVKKAGEDEEQEIDARPSDAIALALRFDAPIYVADSILEAAMEDE